MTDTTDTKTALDEALANHIAALGEGHIVTGYVLAASGINASNLDRDSTNYFYEYGVQGYHSSVGLARMLVRQLDDYWQSDEDDE